MSPTNLAQFQRQLAVGRPAIATDNASHRLAQKCVQAFSARRTWIIKKTIVAVAAVQSKRLLAPWLQPLSSVFFTGAPALPLGPRDTERPRPPSSRLRGPKSSPGTLVPQRRSQRSLQQHVGYLMPAGEVGHHGSQAWPDGVGADFWGNRGAVEVSAARASAHVD